MGKIGISDTDYSSKSLKPKIDTFSDGGSDNFLSVNVKIVLNSEGNVVQTVH